MKVQITGIADVNKILREIGPREAKNLMRATVQDVARQVAKTAKSHTPKREGELRKGIKPKRERGDKETVRSTVRARPYYWRFLEYGDGPDRVEHAMFGKALQEMRPDMDRVYLESFARKLEARLARERKKNGG